MKKMFLSTAIALLLLSMTALVLPSSAAAEPYVLGELVIKMQPGHDLQEINNQFGTLVAQHLEQLDIYLINAGSAIDLDSLAALIEATGAVDFCQPNYRIDPLQPVQSSLPVSDDLGEGSFSDQTAATRLELAAVHEYTTGSNVRIAVLDGGVDYTHPAFDGAASGVFDYVQNDADAMDEPGGPNSGHGTFVSGVVHLVAPSTDIRAYRVTDINGESNGYLVAEAIIQAVRDSCRVINLSMVTMAQHQAMVDAIAYAAANDVLVVVAAGNGHDGGTAYPASDPNAFAVAAIDTTDQLADFSNYGDYVDICAPGTEIYSAYLNHGYAWWGGTSFAAPFVAAQAALLLDMNPEANREEIIDAITATAEDIYDANGEYVGQLGAGLIDPFESLLAIRNGAVSISVPGDYATIQEAIDAALIGDTVFVGPGTYTECILLAQKVVYLISTDGPEHTFIQSANVTQRALLISNVALEEVLVSGFTFRGPCSAPILDVFNSDARVRNCYFTDLNPTMGFGAVWLNRSNVDIAYCSFYDIHGTQTLGFRPEHKWSSLTLRNNTFHNGYRAVVIDVQDYPLDTLKAVIENNIFTDYSRRAIECNLPITSGVYNLFHDNSANYYGEVGGSIQQSVFADPLYLFPDTTSLWLLVGSPAVDAGHPDPVYNDPDGTRNDIGAFPLGEGYPAVLNLSLVGEESDHVLTTGTPTIQWDYLDIDGLPQQQVEVEVGTDDDWSVAEMWASGPVSTGNANLLYGGPALPDLAVYNLRVRTNNGDHWGPWSHIMFSMSLGTVVRVPLDAPTINEAISLASSGDTVLVADGTYDEEVHLPARSLALLSENGADETLIDADGTALTVDSLPPASAPLVRGFTLRATSYAVEMYQGGSVTLDSMIIDGNSRRGINANGSGEVTITNTVFDGVSSPVRVVWGSLQVRNCVFRNCTGNEIIYFANGVMFDMRDNLLYENSTEQVIRSTAADTARLINNTIASNQCDVAINLYSGRLDTIVNNLIANNSQTGVRFYNTGVPTRFAYNDVYGHELNYADAAAATGTNNLQVNPLLADPAASDYSLIAGSPCIDGGDPDPTYNDPDGSRSDIGAVWTSYSLDHPIVADIAFAPVDESGTVTDTIPQISWTFIDSTGGSQTQYEIQVGIDHDWSVAELWDSGPVNSSSASITYAGSALTPFHNYTVRVRVHNGSNWGSWQSGAFYIRFNGLIRVPAYFASITDAVPWAKSNDTILVAPGTYAEEVTLNGKSLVFLSEQGADSTILVPLTDSTERIVDLRSIDYPGTVIRGFTFEGGETGLSLDHAGLLFEHNIVRQARSEGIRGEYGADHLYVRQCEFSNNAQAIRLYGFDGGLTLDSNILADNGPEGAVRLDVDNGVATVTGNLFLRNSSAGYLSGAGGLYLQDGYFTVHNNTFYGNGTGNSCLRALAAVSKADIRNNIFAFSEDTPVRIDDSSLVTVAYNNVYGGTSGYVGIAPGEGDISADPLFADTAAGDFTLLPGSPCIDAGDTSFAFMEPDFSRIDMGALSTAYGVTGISVDTIGVANEYALRIIDSLPIFFWRAGGPYSGFEIQGGPDLTWGDSTDWLSGVVTSSDSSILYTGPPLERSVDFYLRMRVFDGSDWGPWAGRTIRRNGILAVTAGSPLGDRSPIETALQAGGGDEPDGDSILCDFELYADSGLTTLLESYTAMPNRTTPVITSLASLTDYWWRVRCDDGYEMSAWSAPGHFKTLGYGGRVDLDEPTGSEVACGQDISFVVRVVNDQEDSLATIANGFRLSSPDGAVLGSTTAEWLNSIYDYTSHFNLIRHASVRSEGDDQIAEFLGISTNGNWLPPGFSQPAYGITTRIECGDAGKTICLDRSAPGSLSTPWIFDFVENYNSKPAIPIWDGPYCFTVSSCCLEKRGDVNGDGTNANMTDLTYLVNHLFLGGAEPPCLDEANINADPNCNISLSDVTKMVNCMFVTFEPIPLCTEVLVTPQAGSIHRPDVTVGSRYVADTTIITLSSSIDLLGLDLHLVGSEAASPQLVADGPFELYHSFAAGELTIGMLDLQTGAALAPGSRDVIKIAGRWEVGTAMAADRRHRDVSATIGQVDDLVPNRFELSQNYPNPFNPSTTIKFGLPVHSSVRLEIVNILGQRVATVVDRELEAGYHEIVWDGTSSQGEAVASGVYFYRLNTAGFTDTRKMLLLK